MASGWYNLGVPTPFYHLRLAEDLLAHPRLTADQGEYLQRFAPAFFFGNTAPDVQVVSGQPRQKTHFFDLPIQDGDQPAWEKLLSDYPKLADPRRLTPEQTAFVAGYLCHLQADWMWVKELFAPAFGPTAAWGTFTKRLYLHNALRAYIDLRILRELPPGLDACLSQVQPVAWLPFIADRYLIGWRDVLVPQLGCGAEAQTVEVFSSRQGIPATELRVLVESEERMQKEVFLHLNMQEILRYHHQVLEENCCLLAEYLGVCNNAVVTQTAIGQPASRICR